MKKFFLIFAAFLMSAELFAEANSLRIAKQYGFNTLPFTVITEHKLVQKYAKEAGLGDGVKIEWVTLAGGSATNEALLSGSVDISSSGVAPFIRLWDKTKGKVKAIASSGKDTIGLVSSNKNVKSIRDLTDKDKIALPAAKVSIQSLVLQIAAAKEYGIKNYDKFDHLTVTLGNPDAFVALTSGKSEITAHFGREPYTSIELQNPNIHEILNSADVVGKGVTTGVYSTTEEFYKANPKLIASFIKALDEANAWINSHKKEAIELYIKSEKSKESPSVLLSILENGNAEFSSKASDITVFSDFLYETGAIKSKPKQKDLFF
ncbi:MAG: ABC transporter substrate-binding protein [Campylobacteraceae bacterium]|jgi:NitT/TauT family transport system substrate-binding protein|nr:ABC transporter substrate-binding protein [Campylobacteraceae bacterium]